MATNSSIPSPSMASSRNFKIGSSITALTSSPEPIVRECRSPFVTPNHPLYMFGNADELKTQRKPKPPSEVQQREPVPSSSPPQSPFRRLQLSQAFDHGSNAATSRATTAGVSFQTPAPSQHTPLQPVSPNHQLRYQESYQRYQQIYQEHQHQQPRDLRKSTTFGVERMRQLSIDESSTESLQEKLAVIEDDLKGEEGLAKRLRRMKRRLFLESVVGSPNNIDGTFDYQKQSNNEEDATPRHSNQSSWPLCASEKNDSSFSRKMEDEVTESPMEGMEVVLEDLPSVGNSGSDTLSVLNHDKSYMSFSLSACSSSASLDMETDESENDNDSINRKKPPPVYHNNDKLLQDSFSIMTEITAACSTCE